MLPPLIVHRLATMISFTDSPDHQQAFRLTAVFEVPYSVENVFPFFADAGNLEAITPPWLRFRIDTPLPIIMKKGALIDYRLRLHGIPIRWQTEIADWNPPHSFVDQQLKGPYRLWKHTHTFEPTTNGTNVVDNVDYIVPGGRLVHRLFVRPDLRKIFTWRQQQISKHFSHDSPAPATSRAR